MSTPFDIRDSAFGITRLCMSANAFGFDWAQLESGAFHFRDPLNKEHRFLRLRLDDAPINGSLAQFTRKTFVHLALPELESIAKGSSLHKP